MNIFASFSCPKKSARFLDPKRANKMIVESFQLMSNGMWLNGSDGFYKKTHLNHPCSIWTAESRGNFAWLFEHTIELLTLYEQRYPPKIHKCTEHLETVQGYLWNGLFKGEDRTPFVNCTLFKGIEDVHRAYRFHLNEKWKQ